MLFGCCTNFLTCDKGSENLLLQHLGLLQSGDDEGDEHQLCDDARHSGEERTGQEGENGKLEPDRPASTKRTAPQTRRQPPWPPRGWRRSWAGCASPGGRASRTRRRKLPAQKHRMTMGSIGGIPKSTERSSGAAKPTARPQGPPSTKPQSRMGKCIGQSILPTCGRWPVTMGSTKPAPERVRPARHCGPEKSFWFSSVSSCDCAAEKRGLPVACKPTADPFMRLFQKCGG